MAPNPRAPGIVAGRLEPQALADNFADIAPRFTAHEAWVAADRCYFCHDAPCTAACPTSIDIPMFIREIASGAVEAAARTILGQNILGGMCARVCPTETLCEEACVREAAEGRPVEIGRLQRYATDALMARPGHPFARAAPTGKRVAVVGAGPAGLACAHRLAMFGHDVLLMDAREKGGGLNEFGIAAYKTVEDFAQAELEWLLGIGGITLAYGRALGRDVGLDELMEAYDAVFLGIGLGGVRALEAAGAAKVGVRPAVEFIAELRQARDLGAVPVGRRVVVVGGGMTAIDAGVQSKKLGAEEVTIVYRRGRARMGASGWERELAAQAGVRIVCNAVPVQVKGNGAVRAIEFAYVEEEPEGLRPTGETFELKADQVLTAIGQTLGTVPAVLKLEGGKIRVTGPGRTGVPGVWAGGDCAGGGDDLTVTAVAEGRDAAMDIHAALRRGTMGGVEADVAAHYGAGGVLERVLAELKAAGHDPDALRPEDLRPFESLHVGGWQATADLLARLGVARGAEMLDVGCGIGGASRMLAVEHGARATGIDLTPEFVAAAEELSRRAGATGVAFRQASATALPFEDASFDAAVMLHVGMNLPDKARMFAEVARVLRPGGGFAVYDLMQLGPGALSYPMPWATDPATSFVEEPDAYAAAAAAAGFAEVARSDRREGAVAYLEGQIARTRGTPMEPRFMNLLGAVRDGTLAPVAMILRR